jgi:hypothetical protein
MTTTDARPDLAAHQDATRLPPAELVTQLRELLGARLVAYLGGVKETRAVRMWAEGDRVPGSEDVQRLRVAYQAARMLTQRDTAAVAQAWFQGLNPALGDRSPARLLREGDVEDVGARVLAAARRFAAAG